MQRYGLQILMALEARDEANRKGEDWNDALKRALVTADPKRTRDLWPDLFPAREEVASESDIEEALDSDEKVEWVMPEFSGDEAQAVLDEFLARQANQSVSLTRADFDDDTGWV